MARITVEDCMDHVDNLFDLVLVASKRARRIANGAPVLLPEDNDKPTVIALREIAAGLITSDILDEVDYQIDENDTESTESQSQFSTPPIMPLS